MWEDCEECNCTGCVCDYCGDAEDLCECDADNVDIVTCPACGGEGAIAEVDE